MESTNVQFNLNDSTKLSDLLNLNLHHFIEDVKNIVDKSVKEQVMEKSLNDIEIFWKSMEFEYDKHERTNIKIIRQTEELMETLEENQMQIQNMISSKFINYFKDFVYAWQNKLSNADQVLTLWFEVQRKWIYLENIFIGSEDIRKQLPDDSKRFDTIDKDFRDLLNNMINEPNVIKATNQDNLIQKLETINSDLIICEKALNNYLETKRLAYPRFYFVSSADLLDILSNGNNPILVSKHLTKLYDSLAKLNFDNTKNANEMISKENDEHVKFYKSCDCSGPVEIWLNRLTDSMRETLRYIFENAVEKYENIAREKLILDFPAQPALCATQIWWTTETNDAFIKLEEGHENALKIYNKKQVTQLNALINLLLGELSVGDRQKIMTICTIDVHSRDVISKLITLKVNSGLSFHWMSQLRHRWDNNLRDCFANACDAQFKYVNKLMFFITLYKLFKPFRYDYEYLGNTPRLVITPLTDRCYITLTQVIEIIINCVLMILI